MLKKIEQSNLIKSVKSWPSNWHEHVLNVWNLPTWHNLTRNMEPWQPWHLASGHEVARQGPNSRLLQATDVKLHTQRSQTSSPEHLASRHTAGDSSGKPKHAVHQSTAFRNMHQHAIYVQGCSRYIRYICNDSCQVARRLRFFGSTWWVHGAKHVSNGF